MSLSLIDYASLLLVMVIGLPHGAFDNVLGYLLGYGKNRAGFLRFSAAYLGLAGIVYLAWLMVPTISLACFLGYSLVHFGLGDVASLQPSPSQQEGNSWLNRAISHDVRRWVMIIAHGGLVTLFVPAYHVDTVSWLFVLLAGDGAQLIITIIAPLSYIWAASLIVICAIAVFQPPYRRSAIELILLTLCLAILPPLAGFALYFCAVHSWRHFQHIWQDITAVLSPRAALMLAGGLTIASWILAFALFINQPAIDGVDAAILRSVFILLAALTVPHMLLVDMLFRPRSVAKHSS